MSNRPNNEHNVYIMGAGASVCAGLPVTTNFLNRMRDAHHWLDPSRSAEASAISRVWELRRLAAAAAHRVRMNVENIEDLFSFASAISRERTDSAQVSTAIAATIDYCTKTSRMQRRPVQATMQFMDKTGAVLPPGTSVKESPSFGTHLDLTVPETNIAGLLGLFSAPNRTENTIITFNYDLVIEDALRALRQSYRYGWESKASECHDEYADRTSQTPLLKLHGSVNWATHDEPGKGPAIYADYQQVREKGEVPLLVPPSWSKGFSGIFLDVWHEAVERIATATRIVVMGYSMPPTDTHFIYLLAAGLRENVSLREIVFANPDDMSGKVKEKFTEYAPVRVITGHNGRFENFHEWAQIGRAPPSAISIVPQALPFF